MGFPNKVLILFSWIWVKSPSFPKLFPSMLVSFSRMFFLCDMKDVSGHCLQIWDYPTPPPTSIKHPKGFRNTRMVVFSFSETTIDLQSILQLTLSVPRKVLPPEPSKKISLDASHGHFRANLRKGNRVILECWGLCLLLRWHQLSPSSVAAQKKF